MHAGPVAISPLAAVFARQRYAVVPGMLARREARELYDYLVAKHAQGQMAMDDTFVRDTPSTYGDFQMEKLLGQLGPKMEFYTGLPLYPTYSFARVYKHGDVLKPHRDRPACEVSISLNLGQTPDDPWPLYLRDHDNNVFGARLQPGDALIYRGIELAHWREAYQGEKMAQVFLHYVDRNGPNADQKFDGRAGLGLPGVHREPA
jgi:hypothetical protein